MNRVIARVWQRWVDVWDQREDGAALALVRIGVALVLLYDFVTVWRLDLIEPLWARPPDGYAADYDGWARWFGTGPDVAFALWLIATLALVALAFGLATRAACIVFVVVSAQLGHIAPDGERGIDMMLRIAIAILAFSQCHARWSVDAWLRRRFFHRPMATDVPAWPRLLLLLQLVWVYFSGGTNKGGTEWFPNGGFTALANTLADPSYARFAPDWVATAMPLTRVATALTMLFELTSPVYLLLYYRKLRRARWIWIAVGASFHLGIALTLRLGIFPFGMLALYPVLLRPEELQRLYSVGPAKRASSPS